MKLVINGYNLRGNPVGIANVAINFLNSLKDSNDIQIILLVTPFINESIMNRIDKKKNLTIKALQQKNAIIWILYTLRKEINRLKPDYLWSPSPLLPYGIKKNIKKIITINDFVSKDFKKTMTFKGRLITWLLEKHTIRNADFLWCISNYTKSKLEEYYPIRKCKKTFVGCAPDRKIRRIELKSEEKIIFNKKFNIIKDYLLFVGSLEPRKNLSFLLNVFKEFHSKHEDIQLVIVGARKWGNTNIADIINSDYYPKQDVIFTPFISEEDLMTLYSNSLCYVSTSLNEGFGLPQAEAMICGCPVVTAHNSAMIEVVENAGITVKGWKSEDWIAAIEKALSEKNEIIQRQNKKIQEYNWNSIIDNFLIYLNNN